MRYLTLGEVLDLHRRVIEQSGGADGVRDLGGVESAVAQPQMTFDGDELYPNIESKATALCFSLVMNHPFVGRCVQTIADTNETRPFAEISRWLTVLAARTGHTTAGCVNPWRRS